MARVVVTSYLVRFPMGGYLSWMLQWLVGLKRLGHEVFFVEQTQPGSRSCFDPIRNTMTDDCSHGIATLAALLARFGLDGRWAFLDAAGRYHGMSEQQVRIALRTADIFIDMSTDLFLGRSQIWADEIARIPRRAFVDAEPGYYQMLMESAVAKGRTLPTYNCYFTIGTNLGADDCAAPTAGRRWQTFFYPVVLDLFNPKNSRPPARFTTIMSWQAHEAVQFNGVTYGQKDLEFAKFLTLPARTSAMLEIAVTGRNVPWADLETAGWRIRNSHDMTLTFDAFRQYVEQSMGEFSVCKNVYVALNTGWFGDRAIAYLASGRPVVMQDTGFSKHLPCGRGLFAVRAIDDAAAALEQIMTDYECHSAAAAELAREYFESGRALARFFDALES